MDVPFAGRYLFVSDTSRILDARYFAMFSCGRADLLGILTAPVIASGAKNESPG
jgi:hypothetical protein